MKLLLPLLLAFLFASCIGLPDRLGISVGHGHGDGTLDGYKHDFGIDSESSWIEGTLEFPISWKRPEERPQPIIVHVPQPVPIVTVQPPPPAAQQPPPTTPPDEPAPDAAVPPAKKEAAGPWWEDFTLVQALVLAAVGAAAGRWGGSGYQQVRKLVKRKPAEQPKKT